jgi:glyoxylase-like metal-dependent hydrolase (beta-lactamase superfamily II)
MSLKIESVEVGPFAVNAYVLYDEAAGAALLVDPGDEIEAIASLIEPKGLKVEAIVNTHAHVDHLVAVAEAKRRFEAPFWLHAADAEWLKALPQQAMMFGFPNPEVPTVDRWLQDGDPLRVGGSVGRVIHTPGHTPGGCCLYFPDDALLLTGDTLFSGSVGRTDLPGGSFEQLASSIRERLYVLGDEVSFVPGHGPHGRLGHERRGNPFVH